VKAYKLLVFMVSGAVTGMAGCLYVFFVGSASVSAISADTAVTIIIITVLGGIRSLYGSFLGAVVYVVLNTYLSSLWPNWELLLGVALIVIVLGFKGGLYGALQALLGVTRRQLRRRRSAQPAPAEKGAGRGSR
jgi:branched-chain amino acid transport system permease protein